MWVHDKIRSPSSLWKGDIFFIDNQSTNTLLTMSTWEFISQLWSSHFSQNCLDNFRRLFISCDNNLVNVVVGASGLKEWRFIVPGNLSTIKTDDFQFVFYLLWYYWNFLVYVNVTILNWVTNLAQSIFIQTFVLLHDELVVHIFTSTLRHSFHFFWSSHQVVTNANIIVSFQLSLLPSEVKGPSKTSVHWCLVNDNGIFNIIATVRHDCNTSIMTSREFIIVYQLYSGRFCHWLLWVYQHVVHCVWPNHLV